jgi:glycosyltransferase involved in cell wall biosynthesis
MSFIGNSPVRFQNVRTVAPLDSRALAEELRQHDVYVTASRFDPCSNSLLEALHCGLPALAIRHGGHPDLIKAGGETFADFSEAPALLDRIVESYEDYQRRIDVKPFSAVVDEYVDFMWRTREEHLRTRRASASQLIATGLMARAIDNRYGRALLRRAYGRRRPRSD